MTDEQADMPAPESDSPASASPAEENTPQNQEQEAELARAEVMLGGGFKGAAPPRKPRGCSFLIYMFVLLFWGGLFALMWVDSVPRSTYPLSPVANPEKLTPVSPDYGVLLPSGWTSVKRGRINGPRGESLTVIRSDVVDLRMAPRTITKTTLPNEYTATAYGNALDDRLGQADGVRWSRYFDLGQHSGAEACVRLEDGAVARGFAIVGKHMDVLEFLFTLPGGEEGDGWKDAETMLQSLTPLPKPPRKKPSRKPSSEAKKSGENREGDQEGAEESPEG